MTANADVAVLVPYQADGGPRVAAYEYVYARLVAEGWQVAVAELVDGPWCKAEAVEVARDHIDAGIYIVHDADVIVPFAALTDAVRVVRAGQPWAIPHREVYRLDQRTTRHLLRTDGQLPARPVYVRPPYIGIAGGGVTVIDAAVYENCPLDPRFLGWGSEDEAWGWALTTLHGDPWRGDAPLLHLWHDHAAPGARRSPRIESARLWRAYRAHRGHPDRMRPLIDQITAARW